MTTELMPPSPSAPPAALRPYLTTLHAYEPWVRSGKLIKARADVKEPVADRVFGLPEWATATHLDFYRASRVAPSMTALKVVTGVWGRGLSLLAKDGHPKLTTLGVRNLWTFDRTAMKNGAPSSPWIRALAATAGLPSVRHLSLRLGATDWRSPTPRGPQDYAWLWSSPVGAKLRWLEITASEEAAPLWLDALDEGVTPAVVTLRTGLDRWTVADREAGTLEIVVAPAVDDPAYVIAYAQRMLRVIGKRAASRAISVRLAAQWADAVNEVVGWPAPEVSTRTKGMLSAIVQGLPTGIAVRAVAAKS